MPSANSYITVLWRIFLFHLHIYLYLSAGLCVARVGRARSREHLPPYQVQTSAITRSARACGQHQQPNDLLIGTSGNHHEVTSDEMEKPCNGTISWTNGEAMASYQVASKLRVWPLEWNPLKWIDWKRKCVLPLKRAAREPIQFAKR